MLSRSLKRDKLNQLVQARKAGSSRILADDHDLEDHGKIYDEVDDDTYRQTKRDQLMNDDFIVDDDGEGYVDNGVDEWDDSTRPNYYSDEEDTAIGSKRARKHKPIKAAKTAQINNFFKPAAGQVTTKKLETNIDDIIDTYDDSAPVKRPRNDRTNVFAAKSAPKKRSKKSVFSFSTTVKREKSSLVVLDSANDTADTSMTIHDQPSSPIKTLEPEEPSEKENIDPVQEPSKDFDESDSDDEVVTRRPRAAGSARNNLASISAVRASELPSSSPLKSGYKSHTLTIHTEKLDPSTFVGGEDDSDSFKMFWLDYCEVDSSLLLFGKVLTKEGTLVSGVVQVNGIARELYILPRPYRVIDGEEDSDDPIGPMDVHEELMPLLMDKFDLDQIKAKPEKMKYAFELPNIPKETEYLKVLLPFKTPKNRTLTLPSTLQGQTFSHVFGGNSKIFEEFVLQRNIMGPCWLQISKGNFGAIQNTSHCQVEVAIDSPALLKPITHNSPPPPNLTVLSLSVQTIMDAKKSKQEVVAVSIATYYDLPQDSPIDEKLQPSELITFMRPVGSVSHPPGLEALAQKQGFNLKTCPTEKVLLNAVSAIIKRSDPDVFIGHKLEDISLDVLVLRMYDLKVDTWSTFGRRNRKVWPQSFAHNLAGSNKAFQIREIFQGRLLCDIANELGQSLTTKCLTWELPEMYQVVCGKDMKPMEINYLTPNFKENISMILMGLTENSKNVQITAEIAFNLQILSLSKQLTNIAGNAWSHTLGGTRAGRNEYILLHEFKRNKYIVPDKETQAKRRQAKDEEGAPKRSKYQGGLVFEPEKGLHKNYVLVMDFNSLYPSIIQEYNICFTTVDRDDYNKNPSDETERITSIPEKDAAAGVLPRLLNTLVTRRREVKKLLKDPKNTPFQKAQYDIKQQALKLTANSMYGCLGYEYSRFFARPLASLVTNKGREILMDTRQLAESIGLKVLYGDTDSVMIDTGADNYEDAIKVGESFKVLVNERYKLLEIDIDNVFKRLLLHAKKKYAALNVMINRATKQEETALEIKGLDMRRREYCQLSKDISMFILNKLLSDLDPDQVMNEICDYLEQTSKQIKNNEIKIDKFRISNRLSKDPKDYAQGANMPSVQVALRLRAAGTVVKLGNVMSFVITATTGKDDNLSPASRARPMQEIMKNLASMHPDPDFYLEKQIMGPVTRLVESVEGADISRIALALGLDTRKFSSRGDASSAVIPLESNISDADRFLNSSYLVLECTCGNRFRFGGITASSSYKVTSHGIECSKCQTVFSGIKVAAQLERAIRTHISLYYAGWLVCDDAACGITTRQISVYGKRCIGASGTAHGCKGVMNFKYTDKALYNQLLYFDSIFDVEKAKQMKLRPIYNSYDQDKVPEQLSSASIHALAEHNRHLLETCEGVVQKYLVDCGRRYVNMGTIFGFMG
ncbi:uncharacterized protein CANTADRAFT_26410 [Suhomyces tanzawaensis NRRL Y-17324]|uniref:DNA polymerase n=1 Tax=Suhomyces tanzawaensis NRRL Y-17324 TaxID=984487 RepID=A0A1E4SJ30_9ASCO|nr:uncharacterized protein CANTADRAFT_26410 [Suhomyces tanzawaensis NRRL Y-17324]ODV79516.1 hypothetical protein CANTADRAFT_26410 [Suhomyces tanzawaensis NRRL Y-17324]